MEVPEFILDNKVTAVTIDPGDKQNIFRLLYSNYPARYIQTNDCGYTTEFVIGRGSHTAIYKIESHMMDENSPNLLTVGNMCSFGRNCSIIVDGEHTNDQLINLELNAFPYPYSALKRNGQIDSTVTSKGKTIIGDNVVISSGATILSGIKIGSGAVIGADALVTKDVPDFVIVGGNPAKVLRYRFTKEIIDKLLDIRWWDFEFKFLFTKLAEIQKMPIDEFAEKYGDISKNIYDNNQNRFVFDVRGLNTEKIEFKCVGCDIDNTFVKLGDLNNAINYYINQYNIETANQQLYLVDNILDSMRQQ